MQKFLIALVLFLSANVFAQEKSALISPLTAEEIRCSQQSKCPNQKWMKKVADQFAKMSAALSTYCSKIEALATTQEKGYCTFSKIPDNAAVAEMNKKLPEIDNGVKYLHGKINFEANNREINAQRATTLHARADEIKNKFYDEFIAYETLLTAEWN